MADQHLTARPLAQAHSRLDTEIQRLHTALTELETTLGPVLGSFDPDCSEAEPAPTGSSTHALTIHSLSSEVARATRRLRNIELAAEV